MRKQGPHPAARRFRREADRLLGHASPALILSDLGQCSAASEAILNTEIHRALATVRAAKIVRETRKVKS
jgi:flagellar biosynthesis regulator FlbT